MRQIPILPNEPYVDAARKITSNWLKWLVDMVGRVFQAAIVQLASVALPGRSANLNPTPFQTGALQAGHYRVNLYGRLTTPAGLTSSLQLHAQWTDPTDGNAMSYDSPVISGNDVDQLIAVCVPIDASGSVSVSATYSSTGAPQMVYKISASLEELPL